LDDEPEGAFELAKGADDEASKRDNDEQSKGENGQGGEKEQVNAADYDPSLDRREDEKKRFGIENPRTNGVEVMDVDAQEEDEEEEVTDEEDNDVDDMFAVVLDDAAKPKKKTKRVKKANGKNGGLGGKAGGVGGPSLVATAVDSAADEEGYYRVLLGEQIDGGRYQVRYCLLLPSSSSLSSPFVPIPFVQSFLSVSLPSHLCAKRPSS
jgi:serine/threonine-protein kinase PRP4